VTVHERVTEARHQLRASGIPPEEADLDARLLAQHVLGRTTERFLVTAHEPEPPDFVARYEALVARRAAREPFAYLTGTQEFWGLSFAVSPAVLIPRPETELLVELALGRLAPGQAVRIADVCTGSGCIAVALARECPTARVVATDVSAAAVEVARHNARVHGVAGRVDCVTSDLLAGVDGVFDLIVSNPPYVPAGDQPGLQPEVRDHEPGLALFAGRDGLDVIRRLLPQAAARLAGDGGLIVEFGFGQADEVARLIRETAGLTIVAVQPDLQGIPRTAVARKI
jgi:release factor glutamine methyltransferase